MAVNLSPVGGVAAQFFDNNGVILSGGKIFTYAAGTTTNQVTYTSASGTTAHTNPIILDSAGRVPSGEIWLTDGLQYKFLLKTNTDVLIATYDNISGINSNFIAFTNQQQIITATAGQTVFNLSINYQPGTNSLSVFVDGVNQYGPGAQYAYFETDNDTVTFNNGLHAGAEVKFTTSQQQNTGTVNAFSVNYLAPYSGSVNTNVGNRLAEIVSVTDFGAIGDGVADDTLAFKNALATNVNVYVPEGVYVISDLIEVNKGQQLIGAGCDRWDFPSHEGVIEQMGLGTTLLFTGIPSTTTTVDLITDMAATGGVVPNPDATTPTDATYSLLDFTNKNSVGASTATPKSLRVGVLLNEAHSAVVRDLRIQLNYNGIAGYNNDTLTGLGDEWDIGLLVNNTSQYTIERVQCVGYWRMVGGCFVNAKIGNNLLAEGVFGRVLSCYFQGYKGLSFRAPDVFRVTTVGANYIDLPWSASNPIQQSGLVWDGTIQKSYTSVSRVGDQVRLSGIDVTGINVGDEIRLNVPNVGVAGTVVQNCIVTGLFHKSRLAPWVLGFTSPGAALEISGFPLRDVDFINTHFFDSDVVVHAHNVEDLGFTGCFWEAYGYKLTVGGAFQLSGARFIASPRATSGGFGPYPVNGVEKITFDSSSEFASTVDLYPVGRSAAMLRFTSTTGLFKPFRLLNLAEGVQTGSASLITSAIDQGTTLVTCGLPGDKRLRVVDSNFNILFKITEIDGVSTAASLTTEKHSVTAPAATDGNIYSGTYTPTLTPVLNIDAATALNNFQYLRVGNTVTVSGQLNVGPTTTSDTQLYISLPIASNFSGQFQCAGTCACDSSSNPQPGIIKGDAINNVALMRFVATSTANITHVITFTYRII